MRLPLEPNRLPQAPRQKRLKRWGRLLALGREAARHTPYIADHSRLPVSRSVGRICWSTDLPLHSGLSLSGLYATMLCITFRIRDGAYPG